MRQLVRSIVLTLVLFVICGVAYPIAGWALSQAAFHGQANGSIAKNGSTLIGQPWSNLTASHPFIDPRWFQGRPDADNPLGLKYPGGSAISGSSSSSNLGPRSQVLVNDVAAMVALWKKAGIDDPTPDLVTTSASGIDPDITPQDALVQVPMVAKARHLSPSALRGLISRQTVGAQLGFLGAPYLNVLQLNEALAAMAGAQH
ncbi:MAG TPA: potassium-transporting ATPase subunit C [Acidimicrobiales bacterium]|jgi:K+-transporting ATPase ATPase C chain|nr:potassium-transporting ATPase subunit C [Acidimicrobiales bacterium]